METHMYMENMEAMETHRAIQAIKEEIRTEVADELQPAFMQAADDIRNSDRELQEELKAATREAVFEIKQMFVTFQEETAEQLHDFENRITRNESRVWSKWHLFPLYAIATSAIIIATMALIITVNR